MGELKSITVVDVRGGCCCSLELLQQRREGEGRNSRRRFEHHVAAPTVQVFFFFFGQQFEWDFFRAVAAAGVKKNFLNFFVAVLLLY